MEFAKRFIPPKMPSHVLRPTASGKLWLPEPSLDRCRHRRQAQSLGILQLIDVFVDIRHFGPTCQKTPFLGLTPTLNKDWPHAAAIKGGNTMGKMSLARQALDRIGKNWSKASETREKLLSNVSQFAQFIESRYHLERIENLKPGMITAYAADMAAQGLSASTMANRMTAVREVCGAIGKQGICAKDNQAYGIERIRVNPQSVDKEKLAEIRCVLAERAAGGDRVAQMMVAADALREAFGLRNKESLMTTKVTSQEGKPCLKVEGAKGGRVRFLPIDTHMKDAAVKLAQETAKKLGSGTGRIIPTEMSLKAAYDAQRNVWRALGGTRENSANMHGERHLHAREMSADGATREEIMADLGHGEDRSPSAYGVK